MQYKFALKTFLVSLTFLFAFGKAGLSQYLGGPPCVEPYQDNMYYIQGSDPDGYYEWTISGGESVNGNSFESGNGLYYLLIRFYSSGGSITVNTPSGGAYMSVSAGAPLNPGSIVSNGSQTINYNNVPAAIGCSAATDGGCLPSYSYQWQSSTNGTSWSDMSGQTSQNLSFSSGLTQTSYFRRKVTESSSGVAYSNTATVSVIPPLSSGTVSGGTSPIFVGDAPGQLSVSAASGGGCSTYSYQWQVSNNGTGFTNILNATGQTYTPPVLGSTTYYRNVVTCLGVSAASNVRTINVYPHVEPGFITDSDFEVEYNTIPSSINATVASGGSCSTYQYQWQRSTDNINYSNITGAISQNYSFSSAQTQGYYYRRATVCGTETVYTNSIAGSIACHGGSVTCSQAIQPAGSTSAFTVSNSGGGMPGNVIAYQWQSSTDEINWTAISGATSTSYTPTAPSVTTYYRVKVSCGTKENYANTVRIKVKGTVANNIPNSSTASSTQTAIAMPSYPSGIDANNQNYLRTRTFAKPGITDLTTANAQTAIGDVAQVTEYVDGLGGPMQSVAKGATPAGSDMISTTWYDQYGMIVQKYLPYTDNSSSGGFRTDPTTQQPAFYNSYFNNTEAFYYSNSIIENSPLHKVLKETAPGKSWTGSNKGARIEQRANRAEEDVKIWTIASTAGAVPGVSGVYTKGALFVKETTDESENKVIEYKDQEGRVILKKVLSGDTFCEAYSGWLSTYYIYDDFGRLRWVLQPKAVEWLLSNSWNLSSSSTVQNELCFRYEYDARGRMTIKKVPGAGEVWMVYDERDRLVMTQDANLRAQSTKQWLVTEYDGLDRPVRTGLLNNNSDRSYHEGQAALGTIPYPSTASGYDVLTETFYDNYTYAGAKTYDASINSNLNAGSNPYPETVANSSLTKGMATGTRTKVLGTSTYLISTIYYDSKGRVVQTRADNVSGGEDVTVNQYDFSGKILSSFARHQKPSTTTINVLTKMSYDHAGRLLTIKKSVNGEQEKLTVQNSYDELGQLKKKELGKKSDNSFLETLDHAYNIRGWLNSVNKDFATASGTNANNRYFGMELSYDYGFTQNQLNGNIGGMKWRSKGDGEQRSYGFDYDNVNRLLKADFNQNNSGWNVNAGIDFSVSNLSYDANGNIGNMTQKGWKLTGSSIIDQLTYGYVSNSNKLNAVTDPTYNDYTSKLGDFKYDPATKGSTDYSYDVNGNMISDANKKISTITYNHLNLPGTITITGKGSIDYVYDATGSKLKKVVHETGQSDKTTLYLFGTYENDVLQFLPQEEGRIRPLRDGSGNITSFAYDYLIKDHLGNVRTVLTDEQKMDKYPVASLETSKVNTEDDYYTIDQSRIVDANTVTGLPTYTNDNGIGNNPSDPSFEAANSQKLYKLNATTNKTGLGITLKVMAGDKIDIFGRSYYFQNNSGDNSSYNLAAIDLISAFLGSPGGSVTNTHGAVTATDINTVSGSAIGGFLTNSPRTASTSATPRAYINYVILDEQFNYVSGGLSAVGGNSQLKQHHDDLSMQNIAVAKNGYVYIYTSNESPVNVFFDNLQVVHTRGPLVEETHYYPFGLTMAGIGSKAAQTPDCGCPNKKGFNGNEIQNKEFSDGSGLEVYDFNARTYDQQIGRFMQIDPTPEDGEQESLTPYHFSGNNPSTFNDPNGKCPWCWGAIIGAVVEYGTQVATNLANGQSLGESMTDIKWGNVGIAAGAGALSGGVSALVPKSAAAKVVVGGVKAAIDAGESAAKQYNETGSVSLKKTATDVVTNKVAGKLTENVKVNSSSAIKTTKKQLDRAQRIAANDATSSGRATTVKKLEAKVSSQKASNQGAQQLASGTVSNTMQAGVNITTKVPVVNKPIVDNTAIKPPIILRQF